MRKLDVEEWLVKVVQSMYSNTRSLVRINSSTSDEFEIQVGVHQGSVWSPLLFNMVLEALSQDFRATCPFEMLQMIWSWSVSPWTSSYTNSTPGDMAWSRKGHALTLSKQKC